ncbi:MAG: hypothetical protein KatS3mg068_0767 [Candidatus Sericytochromatia bacterium]|nr:MAG: hypothetical protein KatS3mg068_0767 [Candidatus Sericytochromatia bacterium]
MVIHLRKLQFSLLIIFFLFYIEKAKAIIIDFNNTLRNSKDFYSKNDYKTSFEHFSKLEKKYPNNLLIKYNLAHLHYKNGEYDLSEKKFKELAENINIDNILRANSFYNLGNSFYKQAKLEEAEKAYLSALQINPNDIQAKKNLEKVRQELKNKNNENNDLRKQKDKKQKKDKDNKNKNSQRNNNNNSNIDKNIRKQLNNLEESNKDFIKNQILKNITGNYGIEKDW